MLDDIARKGSLAVPSMEAFCSSSPPIGHDVVAGGTAALPWAVSIEAAKILHAAGAKLFPYSVKDGKPNKPSVMGWNQGPGFSVERLIAWNACGPKQRPSKMLSLIPRFIGRYGIIVVDVDRGDYRNIVAIQEPLAIIPSKTEGRFHLLYEATPELLQFASQRVHDPVMGRLRPRFHDRQRVEIADCVCEVKFHGLVLIYHANAWAEAVQKLGSAPPIGERLLSFFPPLEGKVAKSTRNTGVIMEMIDRGAELEQRVPGVGKVCVKDDFIEFLTSPEHAEKKFNGMGYLQVYAALDFYLVVNPGASPEERLFLLNAALAQERGEHGAYRRTYEQNSNRRLRPTNPRPLKWRSELNAETRGKVIHLQDHQGPAQKEN